jgi:UDP-N-acetylglucosamine--dolichyl-phosphate N-acetylglucosaminephosphotransferase
MTFAVVGILSHFSKTMLLFFIPQILNFLYSIPQLFGLIPCPRHRLPRLNRKSGLLGISWAQFNPSHLSPLGRLTLSILQTFRLVTTEAASEEGEIRINNLTIINFLLRLTGPTHEQTLTVRVLLLQVACSGIAFFIRYGLVKFFYP